MIPKIVNHYKNKKNSIELGNLDVKREFNDVMFVCEVYKKLLESEARRKIELSRLDDMLIWMLNNE